MSELFASPAVLAALVLAPLAGLLSWVADRARAQRLARAVGPRVRTLAAELDRRRRATRRGLTTAALALAVVAAAAPAWGVDRRRVERRGVDLLVCLDVSRSMLARDLAPSRLGRAQAEVRALSERVRGDRLGLVVFAGEARRAVPWTRDMESFADLVDRAGPLDVERGGTDLGAALEAALEAFGERGGAVLLISDGEDLEQRGVRAAEQCAERGVVVHCAGLGSAAGSKIALPDADGESFLRDRSGADVVSALDAAGLQRIAAATGGTFVEIGATPLALAGLYETAVRGAPGAAFGADASRGRRQRYQWPLLAALALWLLELALSDRRAR